jgi:hypothetical protein
MMAESAEGGNAAFSSVTFYTVITSIVSLSAFCSQLILSFTALSCHLQAEDTLKAIVYFYVKPCSLVDVHWYLVGSYRLEFKSKIYIIVRLQEKEYM